jgi:hypothetical protein
MSVVVRYVYICNICKQEAFLQYGIFPVGWNESVEGEHMCPGCITLNRKVIIWKSHS